jgi:MFS transporter, DHA2 family, multidrug resistance protein
MTAETSADAPTGLRRSLITATLVLCMLLIGIDSTIANVALPHMQGSVSASQDQISWVLTSYIVAGAMITPLTGWLARRFGEKMIYLVAVGGFTMTSAACGLAPGLSELVLFRFLQGACGAMIVPVGQATLLRIYPREKIPFVMGLFAMGSLLGPIIGPTLGGYLTDTLSWRWVFFINLPLGALAAFGMVVLLRNDHGDPSQRSDYVAYSALAISLAAFQLMIDRGQLHDWFAAPETWIEAAIALIGFIIFLILNVTTDRPFLDLRVLRVPSFATASLFSGVIGVTVFSALALLPTMLETLYGYPSMTTGLVTGSRGVGMVMTVLLVSNLAHRLSLRATMCVGWLLFGAAQYAMSDFTLEMGAYPIVLASFVQGLGAGMFFSTIATAAFNGLPQRLHTDASVIFTLTRNLGASIGVSMMTAIRINNESRIHSGLVSNMQPAGDAGGVEIATERGLHALNSAVDRAAAMAAYASDFRIIALLVFCTLPLVLLLKESERRPGVAKSAPVLE